MRRTDRFFGALSALAFAALFSLAATGPLRAQEVGALAGRVVDASTAPVADAHVRILELSRSTRSGSDGTFRFPGVPPGSYLVEARDGSGGHALERVRVIAGGATEIDLSLSPLFDTPELVVTAGPGPALASELYQATDVLPRRALLRRAGSSLGAALDGLPGVTSDYFGPGSARPVVRGLGGSRVRVLQNGIAMGDASTSSPDHAVGAEALSADRIEIVRGPATLLYGSSAVGGVVNVIDGRIPRELPVRPIGGSIVGLAGTVADETTGELALSGHVGRVAWHASGFRRDTDDLGIPGTGGTDASLEAGEEPRHEGESLDGRLPNSDVRTTRGAVGLSYVGASGHVGIAWGGHDSRYGVPGHGAGEGHEDEETHGDPSDGHAGEGGHGEEGVDIDLRQRRVDLEGEWRPRVPFLDGIRARVGGTDYRHVELEGPEVGTRFENGEWEGRLEARHSVAAALSGTVGLQIGVRDFSAVGEEAFVPPSETRSVGVFLFEELAAGPFTYQLGVRFEDQEVREEATGRRLGHRGVSTSIGANWKAADPVRLTVSGSRSVKLPTAEELFSDGPHLATRSFEIGDPGLRDEVAWSGEVGVLLDAGRFRGELHGFATRFEDFIFQAFTGDEEDGLPVRPFSQADALFTGLEAGAGVDVLRSSGRRVSLELQGDWVRAERTAADEPLPRIPPLRITAGAAYESAAWSGDVELRRVGSQDRVAAEETPTAGYTLVGASAGRRFRLRGLMHEVVLSGANLTDRLARSHVSFLKEVAPLPGREVRLTYRVAF